MICWLDTSAGVAGDMLLGALVDAGAALPQIQAVVDQVVPGSVRLSQRQTVRQGQRATKVEVEVLVDDPPHRAWAQVRALVHQAGLHPDTAALALRVFGLLAQAEGRVHGIDPEQVHFHEVGALDSIADVVGVAEAVRLLGIDRVVGTVVAVGEGTVRVAHGLMPVPVPAVAQLAIGWPTRGGGLPPVLSHEPGEHDHLASDHDGYGDRGPGRGRPEQIMVGELATPTGMALVRALAATWGEQPPLVPRAVGIGAGTKDLPGRPNVVRVVLGDPAPAGGTDHSLRAGESDEPPTEVSELAANVDDLDPRLWPGVLDRLLAAGALDAWLVPATMKHGRPGQLLGVLCRPADADRLTEVIFATTSTIGVRRHARLRRRTLERCWLPVTVDDHSVRIKVAHQGQVIVQATPEFADVAEVARGTGREQREILRRAEAAAVAAGLVAGAVLDEGSPKQPKTHLNQ